MIEYRSKRGRTVGSRNGESNRTDYTAGVGATQQSVSFSENDEKIYRRFAQEGFSGRTEFVRAAMESYQNRFEWEATRAEVQRAVEEQFKAFVARFGTRAEQERDDIAAKHQKGGELALLLYSFHLQTVHVSALLSHVGVHPKFNAEDATMKAMSGEFKGEWSQLLDAMASRIGDGDARTFKIARRVVESMDSLNESIFEVFTDVTPFYNTAVVNVSLAVLNATHQAFERYMETSGGPSAP